MEPTQQEIRQAFWDGFQSIDDGHSFYDGFYDSLKSLGFTKPDQTQCTCPDLGAHGHMPECGWVKG